MNKVKIGSQMYPFLNDMSGGNGWTWNPIRGSCPHQCSYCYVPRIMRGKWGELRLDEKALNENLGSGNFIFVGSSTDMWAEDVPATDIFPVLNHVRNFQDNTYLFQTKNPARYETFDEDFYSIKNLILAITLETNRPTNVSWSPSSVNRCLPFKDLPYFRKMVSIEPVMDFDLLDFARMIESIKPEFVSIGADSGNNYLPEPSPEKVRDLIKLMESFTSVIIKHNLSRLLK